MGRKPYSFDDPDRLRAVLNARGRVEGECFVWTKGRHVRGYGKIQVSRKSDFAHRVAWQLEHGPIPEGMVIMHACDNPPCFRVEHLRIGTQADNIADKVAKGRQHRGAGRARIARANQLRLREARNAAAGVPMDWRQCPRCETWKPLTEYGRNRRRVDGRNCYCLPCAAAYRKAHRN